MALKSKREELKFDRPSSVLGSNGIFDYIKLLNN